MEMNKREINKLCKEYNFKWDVIGEYVRIISYKDSWYMLNLEHEGRKIKHKHGNSCGSSLFHDQGNHKDIYKVFRVIHEHDFLAGYRYVDRSAKRINNICKQIGICS